MALYQSCRNLWDHVNSMSIPVGVYVDTDCSKWAARFGTDLRKLDSTEMPTSGVEVIKVQGMVEDSVEESAKPVARKSVKSTTVTEETPEA